MLRRVNMSFIDVFNLFRGQNNVDSLKSFNYFDV